MACVVCQDGVPVPQDRIVRPDCGHVVCLSCAQSWVSQQLSAKTSSIACPVCAQSYGEQRVRRILPDGDAAFGAHCIAQALQQHVQCPAVIRSGDKVTVCNAWCKPGADAVITCRVCSATSCSKCNRPAHGQRPCGESEEDASLDRWMRDVGARCCPKCNRPIQRTVGCDHMTCVCKTEFCYVCGGYYCTICHAFCLACGDREYHDCEM